MTRGLRIAAIGGVFVLNLAFAVLGFQHLTDRPNTGMADPDALIKAFDAYVSRLRATGESHLQTIPLTGLRGLTSESFNAGGSVRIDFTDGSVVSQISGLPGGGQFDLWLIENKSSPRHTTLAEPGDRFLKVGRYSESNAGAYALAVRLDPLREFLADRAFVVRSNQNPMSGFVLTGASSLFERLYRRQVRFLDDPGATRGFDASAGNSRELSFAKLVAQGRRVFIDEEFNGNGRSCGTCHVENNNFTIDPEFIATLPRRDPLFVAETSPELSLDFENPDLMRRFGLILENVDGFEDLRNKFTLRGTQTVLALRTSVKATDPFFGIDFTTVGNNPNPPERLGWGNDGLPTREFAIGAIVQHATRTLRRRPGVDFRVPTDGELDAMAAFQLALGRQEDFNLPTLELKSTLATEGKMLYLDTGVIGEPGHKNCNACHFNAGGTTAIALNPAVPGFSPKLDGNPRGFNMTAGTNVNGTPRSMALALLGMPRDGGFGTIPLPPPPLGPGGFGNMALIPGGPPFPVPLEEFNAMPLVEAADTAPFFHNHTERDLEASVAFYGSLAFRDPISIGGPGAPTPVDISDNPDDPEVLAISAFLRVLNALENIRSSISVAERGRTMLRAEDARELAGLALADTIDGMEVLSEGALARSRETGILSARAHLFAARLSLELAQRLPSHALVEGALEHAARSLRSARSALANPATLPPSFRN